MSPEDALVNPFLFVVGCPRSGTTLLQRILNAHPELAVANDTHFIPRCLKKHSRDAVAGALAGNPPVLTPELLARVCAYRRFPRLGLDVDQIDRATQGARTYAQFVSALYSEFAASEGKRFGCEKTPDYVRHLPLLNALFPSARFVHIIRDGRDTALSVMQWASATKGPGKFDMWNEQPLAVAALWWRWQVKSGRDAAQQLSADRYLEVSYERLAAEPEPLVRTICSFLGLQYSADTLGYHEGRQRSEPGLSAKKAWLPPTSGLRDWRSQMADEYVELFEALAGDLLAELGYELVTSKPSPAISVVAERMKNWWDENQARRSGKERRSSGNQSQ